MQGHILNGKTLAEKIRSEVKKEVALLGKRGIHPFLSVVLVGDDPASRVYVSAKKKACEEAGISSEIIELSQKISCSELEQTILRLNRDKKVSGILVQLPLPAKIDKNRIIRLIDPKKDVDGFHPENLGSLFGGFPVFTPCTPAGIMEILKNYRIKIEGRECVVLGKSNIVGKPMVAMFLNAGATVTVAHSKTKNLKEVCLRGDILVSATGRAGLLKKEMVKKGAVVVDVGIIRTNSGKILGDVDFESVREKAGFITPVPGGVGPMTIAMLLKNTLYAAKINNPSRSRALASNLLKAKLSC